MIAAGMDLYDWGYAVAIMLVFCACCIWLIISAGGSDDSNE